MEKNLPVPYKSQHDGDSKVSNNDCGPASLAMVLEFLGKNISVGEVLGDLGNPKGFTSLAQLGLVASKYGFKIESKVNASFTDIKDYIDRGLPVIVVGGYGYLESTQDKNFKNSHIMVVCGYREDDGVYVNDPNFWGELRKDGDHHNYTASEFFTFWRNEGNKEGNQPNTMFVVSGNGKGVEEPAPSTIPVPKRIRVTADIGVRARTQPLLLDNIFRRLKKGEEFEVTGVVKGAVSATEDRSIVSDDWYKIKIDKKEFYCWSGAVEVVSEKEAEKPNVEVPVNNEDFLKGILAIYELSRDILKKNGMLPEDKPQGFWAKFREAFKI